ncbi:MAG: carboxypeptidase-like regulatory domain-containing protein [Marinilabiliaceae bacterium]
MTYSQNGTILEQRYSFSYDSIQLAELFDSLTTRYDISFSYDASLVPGDTVIQAEADSVALDKWLLDLLDNENLVVHEMEDQLVISDEPARMSRDAVRIEGVVVDSADRKPMSMVNIGIEGKTMGTATNQEGRFKVLVPPRYIGETLVFSNVGYLREKMNIPENDTTVSVTLAETSVELPEVLVKHVEPERIMKNVVRNKNRNYASDPLILTAFFRETIQQDEVFVDVSEAVIEIYKPPYSKQFAQERVRFVKGRKGEAGGDMEMIDFKLQGGPLLFSRVDIVRQGGFLPNEQGRSRYQYTFEGVDYEHGRNVFVIGFEPHNDTGELLYEGKMRIDQESFAVVGADFEMTKKTIRNSREYLIRRDSRRYRTRPFFARYRIDYRPWNDKWVLNKVRGEVSMRIVDKEKRIRTVFNTVSEMIITDLRPGDRREFRWGDSFRENYILSDQIESYDPEFWSQYNIISPDESIEKVFSREEDQEEEEEDDGGGFLGL